MGIKEVFEYTMKTGYLPEDNLHYIAVDALFLDSILRNCTLFSVGKCERCTEFLFRHINNIDWYSLHILGADSFEIARFVPDIKGKETKSDP